MDGVDLTCAPVLSLWLTKCIMRNENINSCIDVLFMCSWHSYRRAVAFTNWSTSVALAQFVAALLFCRCCNKPTPLFAAATLHLIYYRTAHAFTRLRLPLPRVCIHQSACLTITIHAALQSPPLFAIPVHARVLTRGTTGNWNTMQLYHSSS